MLGILCLAIASWSSAKARRFKIPPKTVGCSVLTRPPRISGKPVKSYDIWSETVADVTVGDDNPKATNQEA